MVKKCFLIFLSGVIFLISSFSPVIASAVIVLDPVEPAPQLDGHDILGYDDAGNAILDNDDYIQYFNSRLNDRFKQKSLNPDLPDIDYSANNPEIMPLIDLDETKEFTRFIPKADWLGFAFDMIEYILTHGSIEAGESLTFQQSLSSVGKRRIYYENAGIYEAVTLQLSTNLTNRESYAKLTRTGFGATSTFEQYSQGNNTVYIFWDVDGYKFSGNPFNQSTVSLWMIDYSVNRIPTGTTTSTIALANTDRLFWGDNYNTPSYVENTFITNDYQLNATHALVQTSGKYFPSLGLMSPIPSGTVIDASNVNNFAIYGYFLNDDGIIRLDEDILNDYIINNLLPNWQQQYEQFYSQIPETNATYGVTEEGETFFNPFEDSLPPATYPPGGGGMTPAELESVLSKGNYDILDLETGLPEMTLGTLPDVDNLPADLKDASSGVFTFALDFFKNTGILPIFMFLIVFSFIVFALKG